jgi:hypothetical protein
MELILKTNNENSIAKIVALAKKLNVAIEQRGKAIEDKDENEELKKPPLPQASRLWYGSDR